MLFHDKDAVSVVVMICRKALDESTVDTFMIRKRCRGCHDRKRQVSKDHGLVITERRV